MAESFIVFLSILYFLSIFFRFCLLSSLKLLEFTENKNRTTYVSMENHQ